MLVSLRETRPKSSSKVFSIGFWSKNFSSLLRCRKSQRCGPPLTPPYTASLKVMKIFSHPQTRNQSQVVQNDKLSREYVETKIFVGGNGTFFHFLEKKLKKIWEKIFNFFFFLRWDGTNHKFTQLCAQFPSL